MSRPRVTIRVLMIAVVVASLGAFAVAMAERSRAFSKMGDRHNARIRATENGTLTEWSLTAHAHARNPYVNSRGVTIYCDYCDRACERWLSYHRDMACKYARAARYPWLPVAADPSMPE
jgi:FlaG/FlaF family flagellin (archaellin)